MKLKIEKEEVSLAKCPPGLFVMGNSVGLKTEYNDQNGVEAYVVASGEYFWGGVTCPKARLKLKVRPAFIQ